TSSTYTLSLHDALPIYGSPDALLLGQGACGSRPYRGGFPPEFSGCPRLLSRWHYVLLLERASARQRVQVGGYEAGTRVALGPARSEEHTSELQSLAYLV